MTAGGTALVTVPVSALGQGLMAAGAAGIAHYGPKAVEGTNAAMDGDGNGAVVGAVEPRKVAESSPEHGTFYVDPKGNVIPTPKGGRITGSPDARFVQARDASGNPTGVRIDGPHNATAHPDPRGQAPHAHVPGVTNPDGTPWLPVK